MIRGAGGRQGAELDLDGFVGGVDAQHGHAEEEQ
jgi:hypothetical protein